MLRSVKLVNEIKFWRPFDNITQFYRIREFNYSGCGRYIFFAQGEFDGWAAYVCQHVDGKLLCALPRDLSYFEVIVHLANVFGGDMIYADTHEIYDRTRSNFDHGMLPYIEFLSLRYGEYADAIKHVYSWLYYAMVAEENKEGTHLGGSIKMLAIYRILKEGVDIAEAEEECQGIGWERVRKRCEDHGIHWYGWSN